jgi:hypothetical protein
MAFTKKINIISRDQAVFWLDRYGRWHNEHGLFEHQKIIAHFNKAIRRDKDGYYLFQRTEYGAEKVYFPYEDCALFAVDLEMNGLIKVILNTGKWIKLMPRKLHIRKNDLYMKVGEDCIKFIGHSLLKVTENMSFNNNQYYIKIKGKKYNVPQKPSIL